MSNSMSNNVRTYGVDGGGIRHQVEGTGFYIENSHLIVQDGTTEIAAFAAGTWLSIRTLKEN